jgi:hypothetical protein
MASNTFVGRMIGAAMLDVDTYEAVEHDTTLTSQAAAVVVLAAVAAGVATSDTVIGGIIGGLVGWFFMAGTIYFIGTRLFGGTATWGELLRTLGFAASPKILVILAILPLVGGLVEVAVGIWSLAAAIVAIRQALDVTTGKAMLAGALGVLSWILIAATIAGVLSAGA